MSGDKLTPLQHRILETLAILKPPLTLTVQPGGIGDSPLLTWVEREGVFGNSERRSQQWNKLVEDWGQSPFDSF